MSQTKFVQDRERSYRWCVYPVLLATFGAFVFSIWDSNLYIGGDVMIPLSPSNNIKNLSTWHSGEESFNYVYLYWYAFYYILHVLGISPGGSQKVLIVLLTVCGYLSTYALQRELFRETEYDQWELGHLAAVIFTFSPVHFIVIPAYMPVYGFPICLYLLIKYINSGKGIYPFLFAISLGVFFFVDLPQPKILLVFGATACLFAFAYAMAGYAAFNQVLRRVLLSAGLSVLVNFWALLPLLHVSLYGEFGERIISDVASHGGNADLGVAALPYIMRFFNGNAVKYYDYVGPFLTSYIFTAWSFGLWILIIMGVLYLRQGARERILYVILLWSLLVVIFVAKGSNKPLGELYRMAITEVPLARVFRTTSSVVIGGVLYYALLLTVAARKVLVRRDIVVMVICAHVIIHYPVYLGYKYYNPKPNNPEEKGYKLPDEYYKMGKRLDDLEGQSKILLLPLANGYIKKEWGYFGPDIMNWMTGRGMVFRDRGYGLSLESRGGGGFGMDVDKCKWYRARNIGYVLVQKDAAGYDSGIRIEKAELIYEDKYFELYGLNEECNVEGVFWAAAAKRVGVDSSGDKAMGTEETEVHVHRLEEVIHISSNNAPRISVRERSGTRFVLDVENVRDPFVLVFADRFNKGWKARVLSSGGDVERNLDAEGGSGSGRDSADVKIGDHFMIDGYANGWQVEYKSGKPERRSGKAEVVVEYAPEKILYVGMVVSGTTVVGYLAWLGCRRGRRRTLMAPERS